ncbi:hypothetical protein KIPB_001443 [Kipferlia bialata]|uniref:Uncharacterized protein n=1 Tax=Kipferlia bialata TaxID=797122 RepID=A0A9K3CQ88_9EUKA|nr:hypothetical protein KIPB_001443 [Kipferlia bialata]|eukprot:g1443.t1
MGQEYDSDSEIAGTAPLALDGRMMTAEDVFKYQRGWLARGILLTSIHVDDLPCLFDRGDKALIAALNRSINIMKDVADELVLVYGMRGFFAMMYKSLMNLGYLTREQLLIVMKMYDLSEVWRGPDVWSGRAEWMVVLYSQYFLSREVLEAGADELIRDGVLYKSLACE